VETATVDGITATSASESAESIVASLTTEEAPPAPVETPSEPAKPAKKSSIQARIDELTAANANKDQALSALNERLREIDDLKRDLQTLKARPAERPVERAPERQDVEPSEDQFDTYKAFVKAQAQWEIRQELAQRDRVQAQRAHASAREASEAERQQVFAARLETAKAADPRFAEVLASDVRLSLPMQDVIKDSEIGPALMTYLHDHPDEAERIYRAGSPLRSFKEMNKLEARLEAAVDRGPAPVAKPVSQAKPPIKPLGAAASVAREGPPGDDASTEEHFRYWDRVEAERARQGR